MDFSDSQLTDLLTAISWISNYNYGVLEFSEVFYPEMKYQDNVTFLNTKYKIFSDNPLGYFRKSNDIQRTLFIGLVKRYYNKLVEHNKVYILSKIK